MDGPMKKERKAAYDIEGCSLTAESFRRITSGSFPTRPLRAGFLFFYVGGASPPHLYNAELDSTTKAYSYLW